MAKKPGKAERKAPAFVEGLKATEVQDVPLEDVNLSDSTFQYRLSANLGDLKHSLVQDGQREPIAQRAQ